MVGESQTLGFESVGSVVSKVEKYCSYEERRITLKNEPRILALQSEIAILQDEERKRKSIRSCWKQCTKQN